MGANWRENFAAKALALILAVAAFATTVVMGWYQQANFDVLWGDAGPVDILEVQQLIYKQADEVRHLLTLLGRERAGESLSISESQRKSELETCLAPQNTNLRWQLWDWDNHILAGSDGEDGPPSSRLEAGFNDSSAVWTEEGGRLNLYLWVDEDVPVNDQYQAAVVTLENWRVNRAAYLGFTIALFGLTLLLTSFLCVGAGHKRDVAGISLNSFHRLPGDMVLVVFGVGMALIYTMVIKLMQSRYSYYQYPMVFQMIVIGLLAALEAVMTLALLVTFSARCKAHTLFRNTLTWRLCAWCRRRLLGLLNAFGRVMEGFPLIWKAAVGCVGYTLFTVVFGKSLLWLAVTAGVAVYLCGWAYQWKQIRIGTQKIIGGNPDYHINTARMLPDLRGHADELNNLGQTISTAVDARIRSERFKAELITNVSHDLKTPLTSIINYVDLLKKEHIDNPKAAEYIEVLDRKSQRLKKLTEDLVEASKASTGSLAVTWERLDLRQLTDQALAECGERLAEQRLTVVPTLPEGPVWVEADGRHLWRVLDNLLTNCAKYALEGTRVYVELRQGSGLAVLCVKNISREALDIPAQRLMERFVRGDESRTAQGSGLGLSIAQSLTELQRGRFEIEIDGDLFKAIVTLPLAEGAPRGAGLLGDLS